MSLFKRVAPLLLITLVAALGACASSSKSKFQEDQLFSSTGSPFSRNYDFPAGDACEAARRGLLSQGYLTTSTRSDAVDATKNFQPASDTHIVVEVHVVCTAGDASNTSVVYVNAVQSGYALKKSDTSASVGLSIFGSLSVPIRTNNDAMVKISSETIQSGVFYSRFFDLVGRYLRTSARSEPVPSGAIESSPLAPVARSASAVAIVTPPPVPAPVAAPSAGRPASAGSASATVGQAAGPAAVASAARPVAAASASAAAAAREGAPAAPAAVASAAPAGASAAAAQAPATASAVSAARPVTAASAPAATATQAAPAAASVAASGAAAPTQAAAAPAAVSAPVGAAAVGNAASSAPLLGPVPDHGHLPPPTDDDQAATHTTPDTANASTATATATARPQAAATRTVADLLPPGLGEPPILAEPPSYSMTAAAHPAPSGTATNTTSIAQTEPPLAARGAQGAP